MSPSASAADLVHATAVALGGKAALIRGPSGSGKSDLALRAIAVPRLAHLAHRIELVSDDQVRLVSTPGGIEVTPPPTIAGKIEVRGLGIVELPYCPAALLALVVDLVPQTEIPRYPLEEIRETFFGVPVPVVRLAAFEPSAPVKLVLALNAAPTVLTPP